VVHLTMYGSNLPDVIDDSSRLPRACSVAVGAEKVPAEMYNLV